MVNNNLQQNTNIESKAKYLPLSREWVNPKRDWMTLIAILSLLIILAMGFDMYMYKQIVSGDMYVSVKKDELTIETLKKDELRKILDTYEFKKVNVIDLKTTNLVDPSI